MKMNIERIEAWPRDPKLEVWYVRADGLAVRITAEHTGLYQVEAGATGATLQPARWTRLLPQLKEVVAIGFERRIVTVDPDELRHAIAASEAPLTFMSGRVPKQQALAMARRMFNVSPGAALVPAAEQESGDDELGRLRAILTRIESRIEALEARDSGKPGVDP